MYLTHIKIKFIKLIKNTSIKVRLNFHVFIAL